MIRVKEEVAKILLKTEAVTLSPSKPYTFVSGIKSPIYTDNRILMGYPDERKKIIDYFLEILNETEFDVIAGVATSGILWAAWLADKLDKPMVYVRAKAKEHGKENLVEGKLEKGKKAVIIEDLISTGGSSVSVIEVVREAGGIVENCVAIFTYGMRKAEENFAKADCRLSILCNFLTLIKVASETGYIKPEEKESALAWAKDPEGWGK